MVAHLLSILRLAIRIRYCSFYGRVVEAALSLGRRDFANGKIVTLCSGPRTGGARSAGHFPEKARSAGHFPESSPSGQERIGRGEVKTREGKCAGGRRRRARICSGEKSSGERRAGRRAAGQELVSARSTRWTRRAPTRRPVQTRTRMPGGFAGGILIGSLARAFEVNQPIPGDVRRVAEDVLPEIQG
jgi:hypothetical protein